MDAIPLLKLPIGSLNHILQQLSINDLKNCCLASRGFYELITTKNSSIQNRILLRIPIESSLNKARSVLEALLQSDRVFTKLSIEALSVSVGNNALFMELLNKLGPKIKHIEVQNFKRKHTARPFLKLVPNIESAVVINCLDKSTDPIDFKQLKSLEIENAVFSIFNQFTGFESLKYKYADRYSDKADSTIQELMAKNMMKTLVRNQATIKKLVVQGQSLFDVKDYSEIKMMNLRNLEIREVPEEDGSDGRLLWFLNNHRELEFLALGLGPDTSTEVIHSFMSMQHLKTLELSIWFFFFCNFFKDFHSNCIQNLKCDCKYDFTPDKSEAYKIMLNSFPALTSLNLISPVDFPSYLYEQALTFIEEEQVVVSTYFRKGVLLDATYLKALTFHQLAELIINLKGDIVDSDPVGWNDLTLNNPIIKGFTIREHCLLEHESLRTTTNLNLVELGIIQSKEDFTPKYFQWIIRKSLWDVTKLTLILRGVEEDYKEILAASATELQNVVVDIKYAGEQEE